MKSETELRDSVAPTPETTAELSDYIESLVGQQNDYGTCVYAMSLSAVAAFNYAAHKLGVTGFQASCADLDILKRIRHLDGPFMLVKGEDALYPQSDPLKKVRAAIESWNEWLQTEARKKLSENNTAHPDVLRHWNRLAYNGSNTLESGKIEDKAAFLENEFTEAFVGKNVDQFKLFGINDVYLFHGAGDIAKAEKCTDGAGWRMSMPVSLSFEYHIDGIKISWSVDTERKGSNGASSLRFDFGLLESLEKQATNPSVKSHISDYIKRARGSGANAQ